MRRYRRLSTPKLTYAQIVRGRTLEVETPSGHEAQDDVCTPAAEVKLEATEGEQDKTIKSEDDHIAETSKKNEKAEVPKPVLIDEDLTDLCEPDEGELEIDDVDEYHPESVTPTQRQVLQSRSPIQTRIRTQELADEAVLIHFAMTKMSLKQGIKRYRDRATDAVGTELNQLHDMSIFRPVDAGSLTEQQKQEALRLLMFIKEKRDGTVKGPACADGRKQRGLYDKEEATSPTVALESVLLTSVIDTNEGRDVVVVDIPGAFLQSDQDDDVWLAIDGALAELMVKVSPRIYSKYVMVNRQGKKILYVKLQRALYGCLKSAIQFYRRLTGDLVKMGFKVNFYNPCVANKNIGGSQITVCWHVDDLKISHRNPRVVTALIRKLTEIYGKLRVSRGEFHDYLGMNLDYRERGKVRIEMKKYIADTIDMFPEELSGEVSYLAAEHLNMVNPSSKKLDESKRQLFHTLLARMFFCGKRARPELQPTIVFLCTRVKDADEDDWKKLRRLLLFMKGTKEDVLTLSANNFRIVKWWVDGAYAVHGDCKSQTGAVMSMVTGGVYCTSQRQKLNIKSSAETELVAANNIMPQLLWTKYFLDEKSKKIGKMTRNNRTLFYHLSRCYFITRDIPSLQRLTFSVKETFIKLW